MVDILSFSENEEYIYTQIFCLSYLNLTLLLYILKGCLWLHSSVTRGVSLYKSLCISVFSTLCVDGCTTFLKESSKSHSLFSLSAFWDPVIRLSYSLLFHILLIKRASATPFGSLCVLLESYHCFAFLCLHLPSCMLLKYKSTWYTFCWSISPLYNNSLSNEG